MKRKPEKALDHDDKAVTPEIRFCEAKKVIHWP